METVRMLALIETFVSDERGATAIEYGLITAAIALACVTVLSTIRTEINDVFYLFSREIKGSRGTG